MKSKFKKVSFQSLALIKSIIINCKPAALNLRQGILLMFPKTNQSFLTTSLKIIKRTKKSRSNSRNFTKTWEFFKLTNRMNFCWKNKS